MYAILLDTVFIIIGYLEKSTSMKHFSTSVLQQPLA
jgi:hypothetical protein